MKIISRRSFLKQTLLIGAAAMCGGRILSYHTGDCKGLAYAAGPVDLSIVRGLDYFQNTVTAVKRLGGMKRFISKNSRVGLLVNSPFKNYGTHVRPEIALAVIKMCYDAGANEISLLKDGYKGYWRRTKLAKEYADEIKSLKPGWKDTVSHTISGGMSLDDATVRKDLLECDVFINVAITKNHSGTNFSCMLKNMMGTSSTTTNLYMHFGGKKGISWYADVDFLSQCIADLNLIRRPDLCIADSTEFIKNNGPSGPGELLKPQEVVAGMDPVLVDSYCCQLLGLKQQEVVMIKKAAQHGVGSMDLKKTNILEIEA